MITLASVPAGHPYVDAVVDPTAVRLLPDPTPVNARMPGQWWPPRFLDADYLRGRLADLDVLHVHFGYDTQSPAELDAVVAVLRSGGVPLVVTVHDLHNPHFPDDAAHSARLDVLIPAADAVVTLTEGAAGDVAARWGRTATVLGHPHVLPIDCVGAPRQERSAPVVAIHAKSLRANIDPWPVLDTLVSVRTAPWRLRLDVDAGAASSPRHAEVADERLRAYRAAGVDVRVHPPFDDPGLVDYLAAIDVMVLPYRFGTHSGWVEACRDAGVVAVVPDCGHFAEQHDDLRFGYGAARFDAAELLGRVASAVARAAGRPAGVDHSWRRARAAQRASVRAASTRIYREVLAGVAA